MNKANNDSKFQKYKELFPKVTSCGTNFKLNDLTFLNWHLAVSSQAHFMNPLTPLIFQLTREGK